MTSETPRNRKRLTHTKKQKAGCRLLADHTKTRILFDGGARSGKTVLIIEYMVRRALRFPGSRQLIVRKHRVHAYASIWQDTLRDYLREYVPKSYYGKRESRMLSVEFSNGSTIIIEGLDSDERVGKLLGNEYVTVFVNEARQTTWPMVQLLITRLAQKVTDNDGRLCQAKLILDTNPAGPKHWLHQMAIEKVYPDSVEPLPDAQEWGRLNWSAYDNRAHLPKAFLKALEALPPVERDRMLHGKWVQNVGLVYPDFDSCLVEGGGAIDLPAIALAAAGGRIIMPAGELYGGIDWGFNNPFCALAAVLDHDDVLWVFRCRYKRETPLGLHAKQIPQDVTYYADPSGADQIAEMRRADHVVRKAPNSIMAGIAAVTARIRGGRLKIMNIPEMRPLIQEAYGYAYPEGQDTEKPEDRDNHAMDALRYLVAGVDRGRTALLWEDDVPHPQPPAPSRLKPQDPGEGAGVDGMQDQYQSPTGPRESERSGRGRDEDDEGEEWLHPDNEEIWEYL